MKTVHDKTFVQRFYNNCHIYPEQTISFYNDKLNTVEQMSYAELHKKITTLAAYLQQQNFQQTRVILLFDAGLDFVVAFCACLYAGVIAVPLAAPRPNRKFELLEAVIQDCEASACITSQFIADRIKPELVKNRTLCHFDVLPIDSLLSEQNTFIYDQSITEHNIAFLQYTSGSTGSPKGVMVTHKSLVSNLEVICRKFGHSQQSQGVIWLPNYHDMGLVGGILQPLYIGFPVTLMSSLTFLKRPLRWLQTISHTRATTSGGPNFAYDLCVQRIKDKDLHDVDLSSWEVAFVGAEPIRHKTLRAFAEKFSVCGFKWNAFYPCYGMAESTLIVTGGDKHTAPVIEKIDASQLKQGKFSPISQNNTGAISQTLVGCGHSTGLLQDIYIVNPETNMQCTSQEIGEIWVSGPCIAQGYWGNNQQTIDTFTATPIQTNIDKKPVADYSFLRTGDLGYIHHGELFVTGRLKEMLIIDGQNHCPQDIEATVQQSHLAVRHGRQAAFSIASSDTEILVLLVEIERTWLRKNLDEVLKSIRRAVVEHHELRAKDIILVKPGSIPVTSSGKIQRLKCKSLYEKDLFQSLTQEENHDATLE